MRILLVCNQGMSTGILVENMYKFADEGDYIEAVPVSKVKNVIDNFDLVLVGPQIRYKFADVEKIASEQGKKVALIDMQAYGTMDGERVMKQVAEMQGGK